MVDFSPSTHLITLPKISDPRGRLTFIEGERHIPFEIKRVYYLYDVPSDETRAGHAHKALEQVIIALSGSFNVILDNGYQATEYHLHLPYQGLYVPPMVWRTIDEFSSGAVCLVLASDVYNERDYYRKYEDFEFAIQGEKRANV